MKTVKGDLVEMAKAGEFDVIVHGCNCWNTMGKGIAAQIRSEFPGAWKADKITKRGDPNKLGTITFATVEDGPVVVNAYTQFHYWAKGAKKECLVNYKAIRSCFEEIVNKWGTLRIGIPLIGAGLAGGDWDKIQKIINEVSKDADITVVEYRKG